MGRHLELLHVGAALVPQEVHPTADHQRRRQAAEVRLQDTKACVIRIRLVPTGETTPRYILVCVLISSCNGIVVPKYPGTATPVALSELRQRNIAQGSLLGALGRLGNPQECSIQKSHVSSKEV